MHMAEIRFVEKYWINMHQKMGDNSGGTCTVFRGRQLFFNLNFLINVFTVQWNWKCKYGIMNNPLIYLVICEYKN